MKTNHTYIATLAVIIAAAFLVYGCEGPAGQPGDNGTNGKDGISNVFNLEGFSPNAKCGTCHTPGQDTTYFVAGRKFQWAQSKHAQGGDSERNSASCAGCHTTEGFIQRMNGQTVTDQYIPSPPGCFACHSPHARAEFSMRKKTPVTIASNITGVANATFDYGNGNLCVQCHQTRDMSPKPDPTKTAATDSIVITTSRWYSHYGVQGQMLMGEGGFKFPDFTYTGNSVHTTNTTVKQDGCPTCHMAEQVYPPALGTGKGGGHTMNIAFVDASGVESYVLTGCKQSGCHASTLTTPDYNGTQTSVQANLDTLLSLLGQKGWIDTVTSSANYGTVKLVSGRRVIRPAIKAGAIYNYFFVEHDLSLGVHNTKYALELLRSSIRELRKP